MDNDNKVNAQLSDSVSTEITFFISLYKVL
jgi:hypothetical protein